MSPASVVHRLAVLLEAGIPPLSAWRHVAAAGAPVALAVAELASPDEVPVAVSAAARNDPDETSWRCVAAAWRVATEVGAPLAPTLVRLAGVVDGLADSRREVAIVLAGPLATSRVVLALPPLGLGSGLLLGFDVVGVLFSTLPGAACLVAGILLLLLGRRWNRRLVAAARDVDPTPGLALELLGVAVSGGTAVDRAVGIVEAALDEAGLPALGPAADEALRFARDAGVPVAALLRAEARELRREASAAARRRAAALGTRLLLPLGVCVLPSFVALGVAPLLISVISSTAAVL